MVIIGVKGIANRDTAKDPSAMNHIPDELMARTGVVPECEGTNGVRAGWPECRAGSQLSEPKTACGTRLM